jgi:PAT family beta-lactamase induction signal transducer AmpG
LIGHTATVAAPRSLALTEHRVLRLLAVFILYIAQGVPVGLFYFALPSWQAQSGASAAAVGGVLAMTSLPWSLKLINGVFMDRFAFLPMGRRRPWIIAGQGGIVAGLLALAWVNPDPLDAALLGAFAFVINLATQGLPLAMLALAGVVLAILTLVLVVRERPGERLLPWTAGTTADTNLDRHLGNFRVILRTLYAAMADRPTLLVALALFLGGITQGLILGLLPLHGAHALGWTKDTYANWSAQANLVAGLLGVFVFGFFTEWLGARRSTAFTMLMTAAAALACLWLLRGSGGPAVLIAAIFAFNALITMRMVTGSALAMPLCAPAVAATQFSLMMAAPNLGISAGSAMLGTLDRLGSIPAMLIAMAVLGVASAVVAARSHAGR